VTTLRLLLASSSALIVAALALTVAHAPVLAGVGTTAPGRPTDRSVKLDLIAKFKRGPEILILGDSRGRQAEPSQLKRLTGHTVFNAAVTGGSAPDAWVFTRYTADLFPHQNRRYIWFVSSGLTSNIPDPRMQADPRGRQYLAEVAGYLSSDTVNPPWQTGTDYHPDGSIAGSQPPPTPAKAKKVKEEAAQIVAHIKAHPPIAPPTDPSRFQLFEHLIAYINSLGARPVIVLNPIYPTILAELEKYGNPLSTSSINYLRQLQARYDLVVVDCQDSHNWGGTDDGWTNPTHVNQANMRRMLRYIVAHADSALD
jgi:hypothetical protein